MRSCAHHLSRLRWLVATSPRERSGTHTLLVLALSTSVMISGCAARAAPHQPMPHAVREFSAPASIYGQDLTLHLASSPGRRNALSPLILYERGDGGWFGTAVGMYRTIAASGLNVVGFSTKAFMNIAQSRRSPVASGHIAEGYRVIVDTARRALGLADAPVILTGWSRGASLAVLVAAHEPVGLRVRGVVAIGLAADEHLDVTSETDDDGASSGAAAGTSRPARPGTFDVYSLIPRIAPRRCVVIQASGDGYLPAARARVLFGADSDLKRFVAIDAHNHRFDRGEKAFDDALEQAIEWVSIENDSPSTAPGTH